MRKQDICAGVIKMNVEGGEKDALASANETAMKLNLRLKFSACRSSDDLWVPHAQIERICQDYRFHFGRHTPAKRENVLYAV